MNTSTKPKDTIGGDLARALADGRYDKFTPSWERSETPVPGKIPDEAKWGGVYPITKDQGGDTK